MRELYPAKIWMLSGGENAEMNGVNLLLYYVVFGKMTFTGHSIFSLKAEDFVVVGGNEAHRCQTAPDTLAICIEFYQSALIEITRNPFLKIRCQSEDAKAEDAHELRYQIKRLMHAYTYPNEQNRIRLLRQLYAILLTLVSRFSLSTNEDEESVDADTQDRNQAILEYIQSGFSGPISLQDLSDRLHLSMSYLSKYIKNLLGVGFVEYVNDLRLFHAIQDLDNTDRSMTRIALDNGFSSLNSFNRVFNAKYGISPTAYKRIQAGKADDSKKESRDRHQVQQLIRYFHEHPVQEQKEPFLLQQASLSAKQHSPLRHTWRRYYSLGNSADLLDSRVKDHLLILKKELEINHVAIWSLFAKEMLVDIHANHYNFSRVDSVLDFLVDNSINPVIDFSMHPKELYSGGEDPIYYQRDDLEFKNISQYERLLSAFLKHCINRYGAHRMKNWIFEQGADIRLPIDGSELSFLSFFRAAHQAVKRFLPDNPVGGGAVFVYDDGQMLDEILKKWRTFPYKPDFLTVWLTPYDLLEDGQYRRMRFSRDEAYVSKKLALIKAVMEKYGFQKVPLYVSRWNLSLSCRSMINDSCYKGAYMVKTIIDCMDDTDALVYYGGTDLQYDYFDSFETLIGGYGLLSKDGIKKPSFYALKFMNQLGPHLLLRGEHFIATTDLRDNYYIVCHNTGKLNMEYFYRYEHEADYRQLPAEQALGLEINIYSARPGTYKLSRLFINQEIGGLLEEWMRLGSPDVLSREEINYLTGTCVPRQDSQRLETHEGILSIRTSLNQNEIQLLKVMLQT